MDPEPEPAIEEGAVAGVVDAVVGAGLLPHPASSHAAAMTGTSATVCHLGVLTAPDPTRRGWGLGPPDGCLATTTILDYEHGNHDDARHERSTRGQPRADPDRTRTDHHRTV